MVTRKTRYWLLTLPVLNLSFALAYVLLAQLGMSWSSLTSQVSLIWPAAGLSVFGLLTFGLRVAPGLLLGIFSATFFLHLGPQFGGTLTVWLVASAIGLGGFIQAWLIAHLNRGLFSHHLPVNLGRTLWFIGCALACPLIGSSVGVTALSYAGVLPSAELGKAWAFWWMGDCIGILTFSSVLAWLFLPRVRAHTQVQAFLLLCVGVGLVFFLVSALGYLQQLHPLAAAKPGTFASFYNRWYIPSWLQLAALTLGLTLIGLLSAYIRTRQQHDELLAQNQRKLEEEILSHTQALRKANEWLLKEVVQRQQAQEQLQQSQQALRAREQHLRSLLDNIPDPVWFKNLQGVYISCNKAFANMLGLAEADIIGKREDELVNKSLAMLFQNNDQAALKSHTAHRYEQEIILDAQRRYLLDTIKVALHNDADEVVGILGIGRDISAQKEAERQLSLAKDAAEEATRAKSRFLANMSHEIRTPLNAVLGYTQLLMRDEQMSTNQRERLQSILVASQRLLGLINDVLDLSKIESGVLSLRKEFFDLHQEVADIQTIMAERATSKGLQLITQVDLPSPYIVKGDRQKIGQILLNLLGNAIKFTPHGSVSLYVAHLQNEVEFVIGDTGPGISEAELAELFAAFKQGQAGEDVGGTGLGLTLSRHLAEGMGGSLQLSSVLGQGTLAHLRLPLVSEQVVLTNPVAPAPSSRLLKSCHISALVVEDDFASSEILVELLQQIGCTTSSAQDGREGLALCQTQHFDIIFTDIRMPGMNGLEMFRRLRQLSQHQQTPVVAVSASSLEHERSYYLAQGFQEFIGKPYHFDDVIRALRQLTAAQFETATNSSLEAVHPASTSVSDSITQPDWNALRESLKALASAAASGDMAGCKKHWQEFSAAQLGQERYQHVANALRQYDLERVETLVTEWLSSAP